MLDRLTRVGLADLVLDLHDGVGARSAIARNLAAALRAPARCRDRIKPRCTNGWWRGATGSTGTTARSTGDGRRGTSALTKRNAR
ncbi:MAG: hypothetical protein ACXWZL_01250 [Mycobacterium sp.]